MVRGQDLDFIVLIFQRTNTHFLITPQYSLWSEKKEKGGRLNPKSSGNIL